MASADPDAIAALMERMGLPSHTISAVLNDPIALSRLSKTPIAPPQLPTYDNPVERVGQQVDAAKRAAAEEAARPQRKIPPPPRRALVYSLKAERDAISNAAESRSQTVVSTSFLGLPKAFSDKPLSELTKVLFDDMLVTKTHKGRYLLCRIISVPGIPFKRSESALLSKMNLEEPNTSRSTITLFMESRPVPTSTNSSLGQILLVREPTFKMNQNNTGSLIRVDSPTDFQFVSSSDPLVNSIRWTFPNPAPPSPRQVDYKSLGNSFYKAQKYLLAVKAYSDGISSIPGSDQQLLLFLNRSQAHLGLGNFEQALQDATNVLSLLDDLVDAPASSKEKALLRRSRSYEGLRRFPLALSSYQELLSVAPASLEAKAGVTRVEKLIEQSTSGNFDWLTMARIRRNRRNKIALLVGDFVGPIEAREVNSRGGGRGIFATKDIAPGELLLVETAFAVGRQVSPAGLQILAFNVQNRHAVELERLNLVENVISKVLDSPTSISQLYSLSGGANFLPISKPSFTTSIPNITSEAVTSANLDIARIEAISSVNFFGGNSTEEEAELGTDTSMLFIRASLFNHQCIDSATWTLANDIMVVRARTYIPAGEEIFLSYSTPGTSHGDLIIRKHCNSTSCGGQLCTYDAVEGVAKVKERRSIVEDQVRPLAALIRRTPYLSPKHSRLVQQLQGFIASIEATYSPSRPQNLRPELAVPLHALGESVDWAHSEIGLRRSIELSLRSLTVCGGIVNYEGGDLQVLQAPFVEEVPVSVLLNCARRYACKMDPEENIIAMKWIKAAMDLEKLRSGGGYAVFRLKYDFSIKDLRLDYLVDLFRPRG